MQVSLKATPATTKARHSVSDAVSRLARIKKLHYVATYGDFLGATITRLADDAVTLDQTEKLLIELKRRRFITGRKMIQKLGQHLREINARA